MRRTGSLSTHLEGSQYSSISREKLAYPLRKPHSTAPYPWLWGRVFFPSGCPSIRLEDAYCFELARYALVVSEYIPGGFLGRSSKFAMIFSDAQISTEKNS